MRNERSFHCFHYLQLRSLRMEEVCLPEMLFGMGFGISQNLPMGWDGMRFQKVLGWDGMRINFGMGWDEISKVLGWDGMRINFGMG